MAFGYGEGEEREGGKKNAHTKKFEKERNRGEKYKKHKKKNETRFNEEYISSNLNRLSRF